MQNETWLIFLLGNSCIIGTHTNLTVNSKCKKGRIDSHC